MKPAILFVLASIGVAVCRLASAEEQKKPQASQRFTLVCSAQSMSKTIAVDIPRKTVDGKAAKFTEVTITWKTGGEAARKKGARRQEAKKSVMHELNRLDGTYRSWDEGENPENAIIYGCEKAPPQKF